MVDQETLDRITAMGLAALWPRYEGRQGTIDRLEAFTSELTSYVRTRISEPFHIELKHEGGGDFRCTATPLETAEETAARKRRDAETLRSIDEFARLAAVELSKRQNAEHPGRAKVSGGDAEPFVSIPGMIADLRHWHAPPGMWNEEAVGFRRALEDVERYLLARARRG